MIPDLGHYALILALIVSGVEIAGPFRKEWRKLGVAAAEMLFVLVTAAFAALIHAHATDDFSLRNVYEHSHSLKPMLYKISGAWGSHEGSMLLWAWMLAFWGFCLARSARIPLATQARALCVQGMISFGFLLFILATSNPFETLFPTPREGLDLNPVLQDIGLAIHPPLLYTGYVGFSIAFCLAMAALAEGKVDQHWARLARPWILAAWVGLTLGITSGAVWAYYELGWGGFWFWDPVENASLMPWLAGTALFHSVAVLEKRGRLPNWTIFLSILAFAFSLLGTFLVRSGLLTSVHAFAADPARGVFILALLVLAIGGAFGFYAWRAPKVPPGAAFETVSRETGILLNNVFLFTFCATVLTGTIYPIAMSAFNLGSLSVGAPYYNTVLLPMLVPFALLMGIGPALAWQRGSVRHLTAPFFATLLGALISVKAPLMVPGIWIVAATLNDLWRKRSFKRGYLGMVLAHIGFGVLIIGIVAATAWKEEKILFMAQGDHVALAGHDIAFLGTQTKSGPNYAYNIGIFTLDGAYMTPERRWYPAYNQTTSEVALKADGLGLSYLVLGEKDKNKDRWTVRAYHHPLILLAFGGALLIAAGGALSFTDRRRRHE